MKPVRLHRSARAEVNEAAKYYEHERRGYGAKFREELGRTLSMIQQNPGIGAQYERTIYRKFRLKVFPYVVYYRELNDSVWVAAVSHGNREPGYWTGRTPD